ncbi:MAG: transcription antitermination factor NusB [Lactococcus plantarum]|nr:transcription antitermination factor NusB [Lactococcus plantarum]MDN6084456.1 transcription antitermination factor NusB [Lactococcus plantarum]
MSTKPLTQHEIRIRAVQALYLLEMAPEESVENAMLFALTNDARLSSQEIDVASALPVEKKSKKTGNIFSFTPNREGGVTKKQETSDDAIDLVTPVDLPVETTVLTDKFDDVHKTNLEFLMSLVYGVRAKKDSIDEEISQYLAKNWSIKRLSPINRVILRLGTFEILFNETPRVVSINEAIELAKAFNDEKDAKFINAILTKIGQA